MSEANQQQEAKNSLVERARAIGAAMELAGLSRLQEVSRAQLGSLQRPEPAKVNQGQQGQNDSSKRERDLPTEEKQAEAQARQQQRLDNQQASQQRGQPGQERPEQGRGR